MNWNEPLWQSAEGITAAGWTEDITFVWPGWLAFVIIIGFAYACVSLFVHAVNWWRRRKKRGENDHENFQW